MIKDVVFEIVDHLQKTRLPQGCDLGDVGNEIGLVVAKHMDEKQMGWDLESFLAGIKHGVSLLDGTH